jgi:short-subunit dehydrogenase
VERFDRVDVLINNAGQGLHLPLEKISLKDLVAIMELNFYAPQVLCRRSCRSFMIGAGRDRQHQFGIVAERASRRGAYLTLV